MDRSPVRCLINSISRFILLVSCQTRAHMPIQKDYRSMAMVLKLLKPVFDEIVDFKISSDEILYKECEELDLAVNEAREFMENWYPKMSKICCVQKSEALFVKIRASSLEICQVLSRLLQSSSSTSSVTSIQNFQHCMQELQCLRPEMIAEHIEEALRSKREDVVPCTDHIMKIIEALKLTSDGELLKESVAVEKERMNIKVNKAKGDLDQVNQIAALISEIRNCLLKVDFLEPKSGASVPPYFRCPLSLELMLDPVIVASGQTYERTSIQKWLDNGLTICPKTYQTLAHTNLIPNYTVKAMITNWCEENHIRVSCNSKQTNRTSAPNPSDHALPCLDGFHFSQHSSNSTSKSSLKVGNGFEKHGIDFSYKLSGEEANGHQIGKTESFERPSHELSFIHSRSESASSAISSIEYVPPASNEVSTIPDKHEKMSGLLGEIASECLNKESGFSPWLSGNQIPIPKPKADGESNANRDHRTHSVSFLDSGSDDLTTTSHVKNLVEDLKSQSNELQTAAAAELRLLAKNKMENRIVIGHCGAIVPLLSLLHSEVKLTQEHAVTALLNLSINEEIKAMIAEAGAIEPLIHVLNSGNDGAKENSAAALFSLSVLEEYKAKIGRSGAVKALVNLLASGALRGKKDAATALFNLSILHENKVRIVQAGAVKYLVKLMDPATGMVDKAVALLANLSTIGEGRLAIVRAGGIPSLVEVVESGSHRGKENAASVLMQLCLNSPKFCTLVLQEGAVPPLVALSQSGTTRAKEKAQQLLSHFRNQREVSMGKGKS
ncbi:U-box domain-containing protein 3 isoform X1 [Hevea brasiliensis]|uniref:U-box domain-containing protein 3 isoform X1 n=1 Tax=Hevea brasiliensis TaxID=3981 RepID=UPI0025CD607A|nr:U-box domain-containing protein 3 isoform X1 [Hevea brasiliensis]XP_021640483.2 U-box domain-containing protein 3 isoform X1 [Hevea brasiliensis]